MRHAFIAAGLSVCLFTGVSSAQRSAQPAKIDFVRDVRPILQEHCVECHGPDKQMNGFRLDRRRDAMRGGTFHVITAGSAAASKLYLRLTGSTYGRRMPVDADPLTPAQIEIVKTWIDQGADWPDAVAGDPVVPPLDQAAVNAFAALRGGDQGGFLGALDGQPRLSTLRGPGGATPLMIATLYGDAALLKTLLARGADPNVANDAGVTALMWAVTDPEKTRVLVEAGADVRARSNDGRSPILAAAGIRGNRDAVALLLDRGANPSIQGSNGITPLVEAAKSADEAMMRLLIDRGADVGRSAAAALNFASRAGCSACAELVAAKLTPEQATQALALDAGTSGGGRATAALLARGADANARNQAGFPVIVLAAASGAMPDAAVTALIARGADVNATGPNGETALAFARRNGRTQLAKSLVQAGAREATSAPSALTLSPAGSVRAAVLRSLPLLQRADVAFLRTAGCVSCHHNSQTAETVALARSRRLPVDEAVALQQRLKIAAYLEDWRERVLVGQGIGGETGTISVILNGLAAERQPPDAATDAMARFIRLQQRPDGSWRPFSHRPPIEGGDVKVTADAIYALQTYAPLRERTLAEAAVRSATTWLAAAQPEDTQERAYQVLGLHWANAGPAAAAAARPLAAGQRADGGWAQMASLESDAYATGEALVALLRSGVMTPDDPVIRRGVEYLRRTQLADGSWFVRSRAIPVQPYFDAEFPHGRDQFISAAASNWATQALIYSIRKDATSPAQAPAR